MKIRGLIVAAVIFFVLAGALYWSEHHKPADETAKASPDAPQILKLDEGAITRLGIKKKDAPPVVLRKSGSGDWKITDPAPLGADQSAVSGVLATVSSLNSERLVEDKASELKRYGLDHPQLEVDLSEKDNKSQKLLIGDDTPTGNAAYAMLAGDPRVFTIATYNKTSVDKSLNDLRDKRLLPVNADKVSRIEIVKKNQEFEFGRNKDEWQILKPRPLRADTSEISNLLRKLTDARMDLSGTEADNRETTSRFAKATPVATAKITDESGTQELEIRKSAAGKKSDGKDQGTYYAKSSVIEGDYKIESDLGEAVSKSLDDFRNKKLFDFGFDDPNKVEIHNGAKAYFLTRNGDDWWSNGKKMDPASVQSLIAKLRDLAASRFPDSGFTASAIEVTVTSNDSKRVEKVLIGKSGEGYIAKRDNEPSLYQLDSGAIDDLLKSADAIKPAVTPAK
jgi:Domain of unknown function (DUF4340)